MVHKSWIVLNDGSKSFLVPRPPSLAAPLDGAAQLFTRQFLIDRRDQLALFINVKNGKRLYYCAQVLEESCDTSLVQKEGQIFEGGVDADLRKRAREAQDEGVAGPSKVAKRCPDSPLTPPPVPNPRFSQQRRILIHRDGPGQPSLEIKVPETTKFSQVFKSYASPAGREVEDLDFMTRTGVRVKGEETAMSLWGPEVAEKVFLDVYTLQRGGKPVIYLLPPAGTSLPQVDVSLSLVLSWKFSAIYPLSPISRTKFGGDQVNWTVSASSNGDLVEHSTGLSLNYLFWEATSCGWTPPSPPLLPTILPSLPLPPPSEVFNPSSPDLSPFNAVVLPFTAFLLHLDKALTSLTLSISAKTDFITFWIPQFNKIHNNNQEIAFRFLPQSVYELSAQLDVTPKPDVVTRIFLLFKGVEKDAVEWNAGRMKSDNVDWCSVVGLEKEKAMDESLFRVLEWGGMAVEE